MPRQSSLPPHLARHYNTAQWQRRRLRQLAAEPLCRICQKEDNRLVPATVADHIIRATDLESLLEGELQSLCATHHQIKRQAESQPQGQARPDWLPKPRCRVTLVCGPPGSGKSTYVASHAAARDIVIDLDEIRAQLSGLPLYQSGDEWLGPALAHRNTKLADLSRQPASLHAWVIVSAPGPGQRKWWQDKLNADVVLCDIEPAECKRRIRADSRRAHALKQHLHAVDEWWLIEIGLGMPKVLVRGTDARGIPTDPAHPWNR